MKILMVTHKVSTYALVYQNLIDPLHSLGHEIVWAGDFSRFKGDVFAIPCKTIQVDIATWPLKKCNIDVYRQLLRIISEEKIEAVTCSTPIGGLLARMAAKAMKIKPVIYEAHGFLFYTGAPFINRTLYKWEEIWLAHYTDALITITQEDYIAAQKFKLRSGRKPYLVHGAGVKTNVTVDIGRNEKREELKIPQDAFVIVSVGELRECKNNGVIIEAIAKMQDSAVHYILCGEGDKLQELTALAHKLGVAEQIHFLGYRMDVAEIMVCSDLFIMPSLYEGVPRALLEAMDLGLPCIGSRARGITDLIVQGEGGYLCDAHRPAEFAVAIQELKHDPMRGRKMGAFNKNRVAEYSSEVVQEELTKIYKEVLHV